MIDDQEILQRPLLAGEKCIAEYIDPLVPAYRSNPLIEALPEIYEPKQVNELLTVNPVYEECQRYWPSQVRLHCIEQLSNFMQPLPQHVRLEEAVSRIIRLGYVGRNPLNPSYARQFSVGFRAIREASLNKNGENLAGIAATSVGFSLIGVSGIGKSTAINRILKLYPQVIQHTKYGERQLFLKQLVWLKLECPASGSLKVLCQNFFRQVDLVLGTNCYKENVKSHSTKETMLDPMAQVAARQGLGVLVIDEIQRLNLVKNSGEQEVLAYLTEFVNTIGVPVILIGTYRSMFLFNSIFAEARRATGQVDPIWSPMSRGVMWNFFMEELWQFQWTRTVNPLSEDLLKVFYEESQGITDIAIKLYKAVQWEAISKRKNDKENEEISVSQVRTVAKKYFKLVQPLLTALRTGNQEELRKVPDLKPDWGTLNDYIKQNESKIEIEGELAKEHVRAQRLRETPSLLVELINIGTQLGLSTGRATVVAEEILTASSGMAEPTLMKQQVAMAALDPELRPGSNLSSNQVVPFKRGKGKTKPLISSTDPWKPVLDAVAARTSVREALLHAGFLKPPSEFNF